MELVDKGLEHILEVEPVDTAVDKVVAVGMAVGMVVVDKELDCTVLAGTAGTAVDIEPRHLP